MEKDYSMKLILSTSILNETLQWDYAKQNFYVGTKLIYIPRIKLHHLMIINFHEYKCASITINLLVNHTDLDSYNKSY